MIPEQVLDISLNTIRRLHNNLVTAIFIVGCKSFDNNHRQMVYPIFEFFDLFTDNGCILAIIYCEPFSTIPGRNLTNLASLFAYFHDF